MPTAPSRSGIARVFWSFLREPPGFFAVEPQVAAQQGSAIGKVSGASMRVCIVGRGKMAEAVHEACNRASVPVVGLGELSAGDVVVHLGSGRELGAALAACAAVGAPLIQGSTAVPLPDVVPAPVVEAPNLATLVVDLLNAISPLAGATKAIRESHQAGKRDVSATAKLFAHRLGYPEAKIVCLRDPSDQRAHGVPAEHLGGHAYHWLEFERGGVQVDVQVRIHGREPYACGGLALAKSLAGRRLENRRYSIEEALAAVPGPQSGAAVRLETPRLVLREWTPGDLNDLVEGLNDLSVTRWLAVVPHPYTHEHARRWLAYCQHNAASGAGRNAYDWAIELKAEHKVIGGVSLDRINRLHGTAGGGIWISARYHGQGYGGEAFGERIRFAFEDLQLRRLEDGCFAGNRSSLKMQERLGYKVEGLRRKAFLCQADGQARDEIVTGLLREEWVRRQEYPGPTRGEAKCSWST